MYWRGLFRPWVHQIAKTQVSIDRKNLNNLLGWLDKIASIREKLLITQVFYHLHPCLQQLDFCKEGSHFVFAKILDGNTILIQRIPDDSTIWNLKVASKENGSYVRTCFYRCKKCWSMKGLKRRKLLNVAIAVNPLFSWWRSS